MVLTARSQVQVSGLALMTSQSFALTEQSRTTGLTAESFLTFVDELLGEMGMVETVHDGPF